MVCRLWSEPNTNILHHFQIDALKAWNAVNIINAGMGLPGWMKNDTRGAETRLPVDLEHVRTRPLRISLLVNPQCLSSAAPAQAAQAAQAPTTATGHTERPIRTAA